MSPAISNAAISLLPTPGKALIVGLGKTGLSVARFLAARSWSIVATDARPAAERAAELAGIAADARLHAGDYRSEQLEDVDLVVASPGVPPDLMVLREARSRGLPVLGDLELFARAWRMQAPQAPIAGITGTNGKSTVTALVGDMAARDGRRVAVGGNIGTPALDLLLQRDAQMFVLELSSFQLDTTQQLPLRVAAVLNLAEDHLDRYGSMQAYAASKARIFEHAEHAVLNLDDAWVSAMPTSAQRSTFALSRPADYTAGDHRGERYLFARGLPLIAVREMKLLGRHNEANALAALAIGDALGLSREAMQVSLGEFAGLPHRMESVAEHRGVRYVNDSKGTNVGATLAAVAGLDAPLVLIAGGDGKGQSFEPLAKALAGRARAVVLIGRDAARIADALADKLPWCLADDLSQAVRLAAAQALPGDVVLLSPACSSLDMFRDYADRGERFRQSVRGLDS